MAADRFSFYAMDLVTNARRALPEIPFHDFTWVETLDRQGSIVGSLPAFIAQATNGTLEPGATSIYVDDNGLLRFGGIVWEYDHDMDQSADMTLHGEGHFSYLLDGPQGPRRPIFDRQGMTYAISTGAVNGQATEITFPNASQGTPVDMFNVVADLIAHAASIAGSTLPSLTGGGMVGFDGIRMYGPGAATAHPEATGTLSGVTWARTYWCFDTETEVLTKEGWRTHEQLTIGDIVLTLNPESGEQEWQPVQRIFHDLYDGEMVKLESTTLSALTTPNHRWAVTNQWRREHNNPSFAIKESKDLNTSDKIPMVGSALGDSEEPYYGDEFVELLGWTVTEGSFRKSRLTEIAIYQSKWANPANVKRIRWLLEELGATFNEKLIASTGMVHFVVGGDVARALRRAAPGRSLTVPFVATLSAAQRENLIETLILADGTSRWQDGRFHHSFMTTDPEQAGAFVALCALSGRATTMQRTVRGGGDVIGAAIVKTRKPLYRVGVKHRRFTRPREAHPHRVPYRGIVWCPSTENGVVFVRRDGRAYFTGNSTDRKGIGQAIMDIAQSYPGFDWAVNVSWDATTSPWTARRYLDLYYPRRGQSQSGVVLEHGGNVWLVKINRSAVSMANTLYGIGASQGAAVLGSTQQDPSVVYPAGSYPYIAGTYNAYEEAIQANLDARTRSRLAVTRLPVYTITVRVVSNSAYGIALGDIAVGDTCRFTVKVPGSGFTIDDWFRVVQQTVKVNAQGIDDWELELVPDSVTTGTF